MKSEIEKEEVEIGNKTAAGTRLSRPIHIRRINGKTYRVRKDETGEVRHLTPAEAEAHSCAASYVRQALVQTPFAPDDPVYEHVVDLNTGKRWLVKIGKYIEPSLRKWAKSIETHSTDQNYLCEYRYNRYVYCGGVILPASQTGIIWHIEPYRQDDVAPQQLSLGSTRQDIHDAIESGRLAIEKLQQNYKQTADYQTKWTAVLQKEWDDDLNLLLGKPAEIIEIREVGKKKIEETKRVDKNEEEIRKEVRRYNKGTKYWSDDEQDTNPGFDRAADHITNEGMRETTGDQPNDHQERKRWFPWFRAVLNEDEWTAAKEMPEGFTGIGEWTPEREAEIRNHPKFPAVNALYQLLFSGASIADLGIDKDPNTVAKWVARVKGIKSLYDGIPQADWQKASGHYYCVIVMNGCAQLKILAALDAPITEATAALNKERKKAIRIAAQNAQRDAKADRLGKKATKALIDERISRVEQAYQQTLILRHISPLI